jgi:uncharacterized damage-inducible protein DinB
MDEMLNPDKPVPATAQEIAGAYRAVANTLPELIREKWADGDLLIEDEAYGEKWQRRFTLMALVAHQAHHRGQMTVLMRQAGLRVPAIYGPAMEDWADYGKEAPKV